MIRGPVAGGPNRGEDWQASGAAWNVIATLLSGMLVFGGIGLLLDFWLDFHWLFLPIGLLAGTAGGLYVIYLRYGRDDTT